MVGVDVEVVDAGLNRLAGTGLYASGVGENIRAEGETYRHVMRIRRSFVMETPREHFICTRCPGRDLCRETLSISTPIIDGSDVLGVIGLVCSTDEDRARVLGHKDVYVQFIERCAEFILHKLHDHADLLRARSFLDIMLRILEINSRGIVIFNAKGGISYLNDIARRDLGLKDDGLPTDVQFKRTGESFSDLEEFVVTARSRKHTLMGQMTPLAPSDYHFATVFTFESLPRMADRVSSLGDSLSGVENLIGRSPAMLQLKDQIRQIAGSTSTVLVTGESGTGKELVAGPSTPPAAAGTSPSSASTAGPSPTPCSKASCSATRAARSPERAPRGASANSSWPTRAFCSSTKSAPCRSTCK